MDKALREILENQIMLAESMWMILQREGATASTLDMISARIKKTRKLLVDEDEADKDQS